MGNRHEDSTTPSTEDETQPSKPPRIMPDSIPIGEPLRWKDLMKNPQETASALSNTLGLEVQYMRDSGDTMILIESGSKYLLIIVQSVITSNFIIYVFDKDSSSVNSLDMNRASIRTDYLRSLLGISAQAES
jgi:hypothetical protein